MNNLSVPVKNTFTDENFKAQLSWRLNLCRRVAAGQLKTFILIKSVHIYTH